MIISYLPKSKFCLKLQYGIVLIHYFFQFILLDNIFMFMQYNQRLKKEQLINVSIILSPLKVQETQNNIS